MINTLGISVDPVFFIILLGIRGPFILLLRLLGHLLTFIYLPFSRQRKNTVTSYQ